MVETFDLVNALSGFEHVSREDVINTSNKLEAEFFKTGYDESFGTMYSWKNLCFDLAIKRGLMITYAVYEKNEGIRFIGLVSPLHDNWDLINKAYHRRLVEILSNTENTRPVFLLHSLADPHNSFKEIGRFEFEDGNLQALPDLINISISKGVSAKTMFLLNAGKASDDPDRVAELVDGYNRSIAHILDMRLAFYLPPGYIWTIPAAVDLQISDGDPLVLRSTKGE